MDITDILATTLPALAAVVASYAGLRTRLDTEVEKRIGARLAPILAAADAAEGPARARRESSVLVLGPDGPSRDATARRLRLAGWKVDCLPCRATGATQAELAAIRGADALVLDRTSQEEADDIAAFMGLPAVAADPLSAGYLPAIIWFTGQDRVDTRSFGDGCVPANSRPRLCAELEAGVAQRRWAKRATA